MYQHPMTKYAIDAAAASDPTGSLTYNHFYPPNAPNQTNNPNPAAAFMNAHNSPTTAAASAVFIKHE